MTPLELEELATFYDFIYREPVGKFVIHVCDGVVCWMFHEGSVFDYLCQKLGVCAGEVTADGMFTVLPTACIGYCDHAPAMLINGVVYGPLTAGEDRRDSGEIEDRACDLVVVPVNRCMAETSPRPQEPRRKAAPAPIRP